ncbi:DUF2905 domain-containing protein [Proteinivorax hydrogeniformans]|uniref:DUF2905 domain-containing protein n=1 Tax=Proteinivorax hydrogeniformans TaxID=1826727 RepID=A0AAU8HSD5_9FIRM
MNTGKLLIGFGLILVIIGGYITLGGKFPPLGRLPGDIIHRGENITFYFPITTMVIISILLNLIFRLLR